MIIDFELIIANFNLIFKLKFFVNPKINSVRIKSCEAKVI